MKYRRIPLYAVTAAALNFAPAQAAVTFPRRTLSQGQSLVLQFSISGKPRAPYDLFGIDFFYPFEDSGPADLFTVDIFDGNTLIGSGTSAFGKIPRAASIFGLRKTPFLISAQSPSS